MTNILILTRTISDGEVKRFSDGNSIRLEKPSEIALNVDSSEIVSYTRKGLDLIIELSNGTSIVIEGFFFNDSLDDIPHKLYLSKNGVLELVDFQLTESGDGVILEYKELTVSAENQELVIGETTVVDAITPEKPSPIEDGLFADGGDLFAGVGDVALVGAGGAAALAVSTLGSTATAAAVAAVVTPAVATATLSGTVVLGPVIAGNGLNVKAYKSDGTLLGETSTVDTEGKFTISLSGATAEYNGPVLVKVIDTNDDADYLDEGTGTNKDLTIDLRAVLSSMAQGNNIVHVNVLTEVSTRLLGVAADTVVIPSSATSAKITAMNQDIAKANGLGNIDLVKSEPKPLVQPPTSSGGGVSPTANIVNQENPEANLYGKVLAVYSSLESVLGRDTESVIEKIVDDMRPTPSALSASLKGDILAAAIALKEEMKPEAGKTAVQFDPKQFGIQSLSLKEQDSIDQVAALEKILKKGVAKSSLILDDYTNVGLSEVTSSNLGAVNTVVAGLRIAVNDPNALAEIQVNIEAAVGRASSQGANAGAKTAALNVIDAFAAVTLPTLDNYQKAGLTEVTAANLDAVNAAIAGLNTNALDGGDALARLSNVQANAAFAAAVGRTISGQAATDAVRKIDTYAATDGSPVPTVDDYKNAGVVGVTTANLDDVNAKIRADDGTNTDDLREIQTLLNASDAINPTVDDAAVTTITDYADAVPPTVAQYVSSGIVGIALGNLAVVNTAISKLGANDILTVNNPNATQTKAAMLAIQKAANIAIKTAAINKIDAYAADDNAAEPTLADYKAAGVLGLVTAKVAALNTAIKALGADDIATTSTPTIDQISASLLVLQKEANKVVDPNPAANSLVKIIAHTKLAEADLTLFGVEGIGDDVGQIKFDDPSSSNDLLGFVEAMKNGSPSVIIDVPEEFQAAIDLMILVGRSSNGADISVIDTFSNIVVPTLAEYTVAGLTEVTAANLNAVNAAIAGLGNDAVGSGGDADILARVQSNAAFAAAVGRTISGQAATDAVTKIDTYAATNGSPVPTLEDYKNAGVVGVTSANLDAVNAKILADDGTNTDDLREIQTLLNTITNFVPASDQATAALVRIAGYTAAVPPTVKNYEDAGISGVTGDNLNDVNAAVAAAPTAGASDLNEIQTLVDSVVGAQGSEKYVSALRSLGVQTPSGKDVDLYKAILDKTNVAEIDTQAELTGIVTPIALNKIDDWAADSSKAENAPTVEDYKAAGLQGTTLTAANLKSVNDAIAALNRGGADNPVKIQNVIKALALEKIAKYADADEGALANTPPPTPSVLDYGNAGMRGVTDGSLSRVNLAVLATTTMDLDKDIATDSDLDNGGADDRFNNIQNLLVEKVFVAKIAEYAGDNNLAVPTVSDYNGVDASLASKVTVSNLIAINTAIAALDSEQVDSVVEIKAVVDQTIAVSKISSYAGVGASEPTDVPTFNDYLAMYLKSGDISSEISGLQSAARSAILVRLNPKIEAGNATDFDTPAEIKKAFEAEAAIYAISEYAQDVGNTFRTPTVADYIRAGVTGVTDDNLTAVNTLVKGSDRNGTDTVTELQSFVQKVALTKIRNYADNDANPVPILQDYINAKLDGVVVNGGNLDAVNAAIKAKTGAEIDADGSDGGSSNGNDADRVENITNVVVAVALAKIRDYADNDVNPVPILQDYINAKLVGVVVNDSNLDAVNNVIKAKTGAQIDADGSDGDGNNGSDADRRDNIEAAVAEAAIQKIGAWAVDSTDTTKAPTLTDYNNAGVTSGSVTDTTDNGNLDKVNEAIADKSSATDVDSASKINTIITAVNTARTNALIKIDNYAEDVPSTPTVQDYTAAGVGTGVVTADNLAAVNAAINASTTGNTDTLAEIQTLIAVATGRPAKDSTDTAVVAARKKIDDWAANSTNADNTPTLADYTTAGVLGVTSDNLATVNTAVAANDGSGTDDLLEIQTLVNAAINPTSNAALVTKISLYANFKPVPTVQDYEAAGVAGVMAANLGAVNAAIIAETSGNTDTLAKIQTVIAVATGRPANAVAATTAVNKIDAWADAVPATPSVADYTAAGVGTGVVTSTNLAAVNAAINAASAAADANTLEEIQTVIAAATGRPAKDSTDAAVVAARKKIDDWATNQDDASKKPTLNDYTVAGVLGVTSDNLTAVNTAVEGNDGTGTDDLLEIQTLVNTTINPTSNADSVTKISLYADAKPVPTLQDYQSAGVSGVTADNLADVNAAITASTTGNTNTLAEIQTVIAAATGRPSDATAAAAALTKIDGYADVAPDVADYTAAGVSGVTANNLTAVNAAITASTTGNTNTLAEIQTVIAAATGRPADAAAAANALTKIDNWAADSTNAGNAPSVADYNAAGVLGVANGNLNAVNTAVAAKADNEADTLLEVQEIVNAAISPASNGASVTKISTFADLSSELTPTVADYSAAGVLGVVNGNLNAVNAAVAAKADNAADTLLEVQGIVNAAISPTSNAAALTKISAFADVPPNPTAADYTAAGVLGVTNDNVGVVNNYIAGLATNGANDLLKIQTAVNNALNPTSSSNAISKISSYSSVDPVPTVQDYADADLDDITVTAANLARVNFWIAQKANDEADTQNEIETIIKNGSLNYITAWAADSTNAANAPVAEDYINAGITGVAAENISSTNAAVAAADSAGANTSSKIQAIVRTAAINKIANYADGNSIAPTVTDYKGVGVADASADNIAKINVAIRAVNKADADTDTEIQAIAKVQIAIVKISLYAASDANPKPTLQDYIDAGINTDFERVTVDNIDQINAAVRAKTASTAADSAKEIVDLIVADAISKIGNWAADSTNQDNTPTVLDYKNAGVTGVTTGLDTNDNLDAVNAAVAAKSAKADADTRQEIQNIVRDVALTEIVTYSNAPILPAVPPSIDDYVNAGVTGVIDTNLVRINAAVRADTSLDASTTAVELQFIIRQNALMVISRYAGSNDGITPSVELTPDSQDYINAGVTGVDKSNFDQVNIYVLAATAQQASSTGLIQSLVTSALALIKISNYADSDAITDADAKPPVPIVRDYQEAGVTGVVDVNLAAVNAKVLAKTKASTDELGEVQPLVVEVVLGVIAEYADSDGNSRKPTVLDYTTAGVKGVANFNLESVNKAIQEASKEQADAADEIQMIVKNVSLNKIADYAADSVANTKPEVQDYVNLEMQYIPTVDDYVSGGLTEVNFANINAVNAEVLSKSSDQVDSLAKLQFLIGSVVGRPETGLDAWAAFNKIGNVADVFASDPVDYSKLLTLTDYANAGVPAGVISSPNLATVNQAVYQKTNDSDLDSLVKIQEVVATALNLGSSTAATKNAAIAKIEALTEVTLASNTAVPTTTDYANAGMMGVNNGNLAIVNIAIASAASGAANSFAEIQGIINSALGIVGDALALGLIKKSHNSPGGSLLLDDFTNAGVVGVTAANLATVRTEILKLNKANVDTLVELQDEVNKAVEKYNTDNSIIIAPLDANAITKIAGYAGSITVNDNNLDDVSKAIADSVRTSVDSIEKIQDTLILSALNKILFYSTSNTNPKPMLEDYNNAQIFGVTADNLDAINTAVDASGTLPNRAALQALINTARGGNVTITGTAAEDQQLTATLTDIDGFAESGDKAPIYTWKAGGRIFASGSDKTVTLGQQEVGQPITVEVSYADNAGQYYAAATTIVSSATSNVTNVQDKGTVVIVGTATQNQTLTAVVKDEDVLPSAIDYQWKANNVNIEGATSSTFVLTQDQVGKDITVRVRYTDAQGTAEDILSPSTTPVVNVNDVGSVAISGRTVSGQTLTATVTDIDGMAGVAISYQWKSTKGGTTTNISGATGKTYVLTPDEVGKTITVEVTYTDAGGANENLTSRATVVIITTAEDALNTIKNYADNGNTNPKPIVGDYATAGVKFVALSNLDKVNALVDGEGSSDVNTIGKVQILVKTASIDIIGDYAVNNTNPTPTYNEYQATEITGIRAELLPFLNAIVDSKIRTDVQDSSSTSSNAKLQALVYDVAIKVIADYADDAAGKITPILQDYINAQVNSVTIHNIDKVNSAVDALAGVDVNNKYKIQSVVNQTNALIKIDAYATNSDNAEPTLADYNTAGVFGLNEAAVALANELVAAKFTGEVNTLAKLTPIVAQATALAKIAVYAEGAAGLPIADDYAITGANVSGGNLASANARILASTTTNTNTLAEIQTLIAPDTSRPANAGAATTAIAKIEALTVARLAAGTNVPTTADYTAAGVLGVTNDNLSAVNAGIAAAATGGANTLLEIQTIVNTALGLNINKGFNKLSLYADSNTDPIANDYTNAGISGVSNDNLVLVNRDILASNATGTNTVAKIQAIANKAIALDNLADWAALNAAGANTPPTLSDYQTAEVTGVREDLVPYLNAKVLALANAADADTKEEIQALVDDASLALIADYGKGGTDNSPAPVLQDFTNIGVSGVTSANLAKVRLEITLTNKADVNQVNEVEIVVKRAIALLKISAYADDDRNDKPTAQDYANAGVSGVTGDNLDAINAKVKELTGVQVDTENKLQAFVTLNAALQAISDYAENGTPTPTSPTYARGGIKGVDDNNLTLVNRDILASNAAGTNTPGKIQAIVDKAIALDTLADWAERTTAGPNPPTLSDYQTAEVTGVREDLVPYLNAEVLALTSRADGDTTEDIQALVDDASLALIADYGKGGTVNSPAPVLQDFTNIGVSGVTSANLAKVRLEITLTNKADVNQVNEVEIVVKRAIALLKISAYADNSLNPPPVKQDYDDAGITGVTNTNTSVVNNKLKELDVKGTDVDATEELQAIVTPVVAKNAISVYAQSGGTPPPAKEVYLNAGIKGVDDNNLTLVNRDILQSDAAGTNTLEKIQAIVDKAIALDTLADWAALNAAGANTPPTLSVYQTAEVTGVREDLVPYLNARVLALPNAVAGDTTGEIQALVEGASLDLIADYGKGGTPKSPAPVLQDFVNIGLTTVTSANLDKVKLEVAFADKSSMGTKQGVEAVVKSAIALLKISNYADDKRSGVPTTTDYTDAGVTGVTNDNLNHINAEVRKRDSKEVDTKDELQTLVTVSASIKAINDYAENGLNPPTKEVYAAAGIKGVDENNLTLVNRDIDASDAAGTNTPEKIQAIVDKAIAVDKIADYAVDNNANPTPILKDYQTAGVTGVREDLVSYLNTRIAALSRATDADTTGKIQNWVDDASLDLVSAYAGTTASAPVPILQDYVNMGTKGVTEDNLAKVNAEIDALKDADAANTFDEVQAIADKAIALLKIDAYAEDNRKPAPDVDDYSAAGVTGINSRNVNDANTIIDGLEGGEANTTAKIQTAIASLLGFKILRDYASSDVAPIASDYTGLGISTVDNTNLGAVNTAIRGSTSHDTNALWEIHYVTAAASGRNVNAAALTKISTYALNTSDTIPNAGDYTNVGILGVISGNLNNVNAAVRALDNGDLKSVYQAAFSVIKPTLRGNEQNLVNKISAYADSDVVPTAKQYNDIGLSGVNNDNLTDVNAAVRAASDGDVDTVGKLVALVKKVVALDKIDDYAHDDDSAVPKYQDYLDAGVTGVHESLVSFLNTIVRAGSRDDFDETQEIQNIVDDASISLISFYAGPAVGAAVPVLQDYQNAAITGVTEDNLATVNAAINALNDASAANTKGEIQGVANGAFSFGVITAYADNNGASTAPNSATYTAAGVTVGANLLPHVNNFLKNLSGNDVATLAKLRKVVLHVRFQRYAESDDFDLDSSGTQNPSAADYSDLGITDVTSTGSAANLPIVNNQIKASNAAGTDTIEEIKAIVTRGIALNQIDGYAGGITGIRPPTDQTYADAGVTGVYSTAFITRLNALVLAKARGNLETSAAVQVLVSDASVDVIEAYAGGGVFKPREQDYTNVGATGVNNDNITLVNKHIRSLSTANVDDAAKVRAEVTKGIIIDKIADYASDSLNPEPIFSDYTTLNLTDANEVTEDNLDDVNKVIEGSDRGDVDTLVEITKVVKVYLAVTRISKYAETSGGSAAPTVEDYTVLDITTVAGANLNTTNGLIAGKTKQEVDSVDEIRALLANSEAYRVIRAYADDDSNPAPTVPDYNAAGFAKVVSGNLTLVNAQIDAAGASDVDTVGKIEALVKKGVALAKIDDYAHAEANPVPTVQDYIDAGVQGIRDTVGDKLLDSINTIVKGGVRGNFDTTGEIQAKVPETLTNAIFSRFIESGDNSIIPILQDYVALGATTVTNANLSAVNAIIHSLRDEIGGAVKDPPDTITFIDKTVAVLIIMDYADTGTTAPSVANYTTAGFAAVAGASGGGVDNITIVNREIAASDRDGTNTYAKISAIVKRGVALDKIDDYAETGTTAPIITDYTDAGVTGVYTGLLTALNARILALVDTQADTTVKVQAQVALTSVAVISAYAGGGAGNPRAPVQDDYHNAGATGVNNDNITVVNEYIQSLTAAAVNTAAKVRAEATKGIIIDKIADYASDSSNASPIPGDYTDLGITGVNNGNVGGVNSAIADATRAQADTLGEITGIVNRYIAIVKIQAYAADSTNNPAPTATDYNNAGFAAVKRTAPNNIDLVNAQIDAVNASGVDSYDKIEALVKKGVALDKIDDYAETGATAPIITDYTDAGVTGVHAQLLTALNTRIAALNNNQADSTAKVQTQVELTSVAVISAYAGGAGTPPPRAPVQQDYHNAGATDVDNDNITVVNEYIKSLEAADVNTAAEVRTEANKGIIIDKIADYASDSRSTKPVPGDYTALGINGVDGSNIDTINSLVAAAERDKADSIADIQKIVGSLVIVEKISEYADDQSNAAPTIPDYKALGFTNINTQADLNKANTAIAGADKEDVDSLAEIQTLINGVFALGPLIAYASTGTTAPTLVEYAAAGFTQVKSGNKIIVDREVRNADAADVNTLDKAAIVVKRGVALDKFADWAETSGSSTTPTVQDYIDAGVQGVRVTLGNNPGGYLLFLTNNDLRSETRASLDETAEIQNLVPYALIRGLFERWAAQASIGTTPILDDYTSAGATGVTNDNIDAVNTFFINDSFNYFDFKSVSGFQALVGRFVAAAVINKYAADGGTPPALADYTNAGFSDVTNANKGTVDAVINLADDAGTNTLTELTTLVKRGIALDKIDKYVADAVNAQLPQPQDYSDAGIVGAGVTNSNLNYINTQLDASSTSADTVDTLVELQQLVSLNIIKNYARADGNAAPKVEDYAAVLENDHVSNANLAKVNEGVKALDEADVNTAAKIQAVVNTARLPDVLIEHLIVDHGTVSAKVEDADGINDPNAITYQWFIADNDDMTGNPTDVTGATSKTYTVDLGGNSALIDKYLGVKVSYTDASGTPYTNYIDPSQFGAFPANRKIRDDVGAVTITGTVQTGNTLTATVTDPDSTAAGNVVTAVTAYQWKNNGTNITGATSRTYTVTAGDVGDTITVEVTYTDPEFNIPKTVTSNAASASGLRQLISVDDTIVSYGISSDGATLSAPNVERTSPVDGGSGYDTLAFNISQETTIDFTLLDKGHIKNIEEVRLDDSIPKATSDAKQPQVLVKLSAENVLDMTDDNNELVINLEHITSQSGAQGAGQYTVELTSGDFMLKGVEVRGEGASELETYHIYVSTTSAARVLLDEDITLQGAGVI